MYIYICIHSCIWDKPSLGGLTRSPVAPVTSVTGIPQVPKKNMISPTSSWYVCYGHPFHTWSTENGYLIWYDRQPQGLIQSNFWLPIQCDNVYSILYIYMYIYLYINPMISNIYIYICICIYIYIYLHVYMYICIYIYINRCMIWWCIYIYIHSYGQDGCAVWTAQGQCLMRFGMSSISPDGWWDLFPKQETLNPKSHILRPKSNMKSWVRLESKILLNPW